MMNPDQIYALRQLQHGDLRVEAERARAIGELTGKHASRDCGGLATWLRRLSMRWTRSIMLTGLPEATHPAGQPE
jgi:hypothetical protein